MSLPLLAALRRGAPTGGRNADGKRRAVDAVPDSSPRDVIPGDLLNLVTDFLADPSASPVSVCEAIANWCLSHKAPCSDDNVFRLALVAFGGNAPAPGPVPGPFHNWRDLFFWLCAAFTRENMGFIWGSLRHPGRPAQREPPERIKALLREAGETSEDQRTLDVLVHGMRAYYISHGRQIGDHSSVTYRAREHQRQLDWENNTETSSYARSKRTAFEALWWFLKARGGGKFELDYYDDLDAELYRLLERMYRGHPRLAWDAETKKQIGDLLARGASVDFDGMDGNDLAGTHPFVPVPGSAGGETATTIQLALLTGNVDLVEMLVPDGPIQLTWHDANMAALARFMAVPGAGKRHVAFLERMCSARVEALLHARERLEDASLARIFQGAHSLVKKLKGIVDELRAQGKPELARKVNELRKTNQDYMAKYGYYT